MAELSERIWASVTPERKRILEAWADELGLQFGPYMALCCWLGAQQLRRAIAPEEVFSRDKQFLANLVEAVSRQKGVDAEEVLKKAGIQDVEVLRLLQE